VDPPDQNSPTRLRQNSPTQLFSLDHSQRVLPDFMAFGKVTSSGASRFRILKLLPLVVITTA
jgi:hypothetical protein